ncbi:hypothetical protein RB195_019564 [Necator americanus]|uniref:CD36 family protein n=1 Tax=Necator americanus TaxID=51031 RepID=A0ABR1CES8_NECAM
MAFNLHYDSDLTINGIDAMRFKMDGDSYDTTMELNKGTHYNNTVFLPPGIIPLRCLPGQNVLAPFAGFLSPPHFLWSPQEVRDNMIGLKPNVSAHEPALFDIQPLTGSTVNGRFRMQFSIPIYNDGSLTESKQLYNSFLPAFWVTIDVKMLDYAHNYIYFNTKELPNIILGVGIGLVVVPVLTGLIWIFFCMRKRRTTIAFSLSKAATEESWTHQ